MKLNFRSCICATDGRFLRKIRKKDLINSDPFPPQRPFDRRRMQITRHTEYQNRHYLFPRRTEKGRVPLGNSGISRGSIPLEANFAVALRTHIGPDRVLPRSAARDGADFIDRQFAREVAPESALRLLIVHDVGLSDRHAELHDSERLTRRRRLRNQKNVENRNLSWLLAA